MGALNLEQQKAVALASARARVAENSDQPRTFGQRVSDMYEGATQAPYDIMQSGIELGARGLDAVGVTDQAFPKTKQFFDQSNNDAAAIGGADPNSGFYKGGRIASQIAATLPAMALKVPGLAANLPRLAPAVDGALQGATAAAATSNSSDKPLGEQLGMGAAAGGALPILASGLSRVVSPVVAPAAKALMDRGIPLTPGQILGGGWKATEDKLSSVPIVGDLIKNGQRNSIVGLNRAAYNDALAPIGQSVPAHVQPGRDGVDFVQKQISNRYDQILPQMTGALDQQLVQDVGAIATKLKAEGVTDEAITRFKNVVDGQLAQRANNTGGVFAGDTLKGIQSDLGRLASHHGSSADSNDRALGAAIGDVHEAFNDMLLRNNPNMAQPLQEANQAWAQYTRIRRASSALGSKDGVFSPAQYANAVKAGDKSVGKGSYARGRALQQDLSDPANQLLPSTVPDSGTPGRLMMAALVGGLPVINPAMGAAGLAGAGLYTKGGQKLAAALLTKRPASAPAVAGAIKKYGVLGAPALGSLIGGSGD